MVKEKMARAMIEPLVNKTMSDIQKDPERTLRNIIDLLLSFPNGRFSNDLFQIAQKMLTYEQSAYYVLIKKVVDFVNLENLKIFSMNVGYNACTTGAKIIRKYRDDFNFNIPWMIFININELSEGNLSRIVSEAKQLGIYMFAVFGDNAVTMSTKNVYEENSDCAFVLFTDAIYIYDNVIEEYKDIYNVLISINNDDNKYLSNAIEILSKYKKFYSAHIYYTDDNYLDVLTEKRLNELQKYSVSFLFCVPDLKCSVKTFEYLKNFSRKIRDGQKYSYVIMDIYDDIVKIDNMISGNTHEFIILEDGTVSVSNDVISNTEYNINNMSFSDVLEKLNN